MESASWTDEEDTPRDPLDWDLENALARAILGDVDGFRVPSKSLAVASTATLSDDAEEERLIDQLHARLFPKPKTALQQAKKGIERPSVQKRSRVRPPHTVTSSAPALFTPRRSISPEKIDLMINRFRLHEAKRARKLEMLTHETSQRSSTSSASFDLVSPRSRELTRGLPSFQHRQAMAIANRERELERQRRSSEEKERTMCGSLSQTIRSPCICGSSGSSTVMSDAHSPACTRFMEACEKFNATNNIQGKKHAGRRTIDDMMRFHEEGQRKRAEMAQAQLEREQRETTFTPQINRNSLKIYEDLVQSGRLQDRRSRRTPVSKSPPKQPALGVKSKIVLMNTRRRSSITSRSSNGSKGPRRLPSHSLIPKVGCFSESHWTKQLPGPARKDTPPASPQPPPFQVPWTAIPFTNATCEFIITNFDQPSWFP